VLEARDNLNESSSSSSQKKSFSMLHVLLIIFLQLNYSLMNNPLLIAIPYPFNTSISSQIICFTNDQGPILSMNILAMILYSHTDNPLLKNSKDNIDKNGSLILNLPTHFNYSQLDSKVECRSIYHHGQQKISYLDVFSVAEIPRNDLLTIDAGTKQIVTMNCLAYGTNLCMSEYLHTSIVSFLLLVIHWSFSKDNSKTSFGVLPIGIRISQTYNLNDTLIIEHASYSDHHGYYQCLVTNKLLGRIYEDRLIIYLNIERSSLWIALIGVFVVIGICILILIICSKYYHKKKHQQLDEINRRKDSQVTLDDLNREINSETIFDEHQQMNTQTDSRRSFDLRTSPQFILENPFLDRNVRSITRTEKLISKDSTTFS